MGLAFEPGAGLGWGWEVQGPGLFLKYSCALIDMGGGSELEWTG